MFIAGTGIVSNSVLPVSAVPSAMMGANLVKILRIVGNFLGNTSPGCNNVVSKARPAKHIPITIVTQDHGLAQFLKEVVIQ